MTRYWSYPDQEIYQGIKDIIQVLKQINVTLTDLTNSIDWKGKRS